jgi:hypothetical protein
MLKVKRNEANNDNYMCQLPTGILYLFRETVVCGTLSIGSQWL